MSLYELIVFVISKILFVTLSGAGPPFSMLYLIPKSALGPPGLCEAVRRIPPFAFLERMMCEAAGVDMMPFSPMMSFSTPFAAPILTMIWITSGE